MLRARIIADAAVLALVTGAALRLPAGINGPASRCTCVLAERAKGRGSVDRTRYGRNRFCTRSFYKHHEQQISKAAVLYDAQAIKKAITSHKVRHFSAANAVHAGGAMA